jgi:hypothetical protein
MVCKHDTGIYILSIKPLCDKCRKTVENYCWHKKGIEVNKSFLRCPECNFKLEISPCFKCKKFTKTIQTEKPFFRICEECGSYKSYSELSFFEDIHGSPAFRNKTYTFNKNQEKLNKMALDKIALRKVINFVFSETKVILNSVEYDLKGFDFKKALMGLTGEERQWVLKTQKAYESAKELKRRNL